MTTRSSVHDTLEQAYDYADAFVAETNAVTYRGRPVTGYDITVSQGIYRPSYRVHFIDAVQVSA